MSLYDFLESDNVLLLGEGNFSFSCCLLMSMKEKYNYSKFSNVYATCYQNEISEAAARNIEYLKCLGAEVLLGVDATKLQDEKCLPQKFEKIIFNFPHVGGKMKIHLNRNLLRDFFLSSSEMLGLNGEVVVTLCSGQGGTDFDAVQRRWPDTWQIVEQAAHGNMILYHVELFPHKTFENYQPVGYRGKEQKFSIKSAVVHAFRKVVPPINELSEELLCNITNFHPTDQNKDVLVQYAYKLALDHSPLLRVNSPQYIVLEILKDCCLQNTNEFIILSDELPYHTAFCLDQASCFYQNCPSSLRSSLLQVKPKMMEENFLLSGLVFYKRSSSFLSNLVRCEAIVGGRFSENVITSFFRSLKNQFKFEEDVLSESSDDFFIPLENEHFKEKIIAIDINHHHISIDIDYLCSYLFKITMKELWTTEIKLELEKGCLNVPSLYPQIYSFDISFVSKNEVDEWKLFQLLNQLPDNLIESLELLSIFQEADGMEKSYCYRIKYISYDKPLYRKRVIEIHQNVVGKLLEKAFNVHVI